MAGMTREEWLGMVRTRRDQWMVAFSKSEARAQVVAGMATAVGGLLLAGVEHEARALFPPVDALHTAAAIVGVLGAISVGWALVTAVAAIYPPTGRHLHGFPLPLPDALGRRLGLLAERYDTTVSKLRWLDKDMRSERLQDFASHVVVPYASTEQLDPSDELIRAELFNAWATWWVAERNAELLRQSVRALFTAVSLAGLAYLLTSI